MRKSALFVPGNQASMHVSAFAFDVDAIIFDLEDAVALHHKESARTLLRHSLSTLTMFKIPKYVRVNPIDSPFFKEDIQQMIQAPIDGLMIPKADVYNLPQIIKWCKEVEKQHNKKQTPFWIIVESALGVETLWEMVNTTDRITHILLGGEDLMSDLHVKQTHDRQELAYPRAKVAMVSKAKKLLCYDTPYVEINNEQGLLDDAIQAKNVGFDSKIAIHPSQVDVINAVFSYTEDEINQAKEIIEAYNQAQQQGLGAFSFQGKMVDKPILDRAMHIINSIKGNKHD